jgi:phenylacetate-CoA ligase
MNPDEVYVEILDPETMEPVKDGEEGLVTVTPLGVKGFPLIRYINGDISFLVPGRCSCGRMLQRLGPIFARKDHMMKIKGVKVYPEVIKKMVEEFEDVDIFQLEAYTGDFMDLLKVCIPHLPGAEDQNLLEKSTERAALLQDKIRRALGVTLEVRSINREELQQRVRPPEMRKPVIFLDNRKK